MKRYRFKIEYNGAPFCGWQRQTHLSSVQGEIEDALTKIGELNAMVHGAGRTDAGVHATGQVAHTDLKKPWQSFRLMEALNANLRQSSQAIAILSCEGADDEFHARFSAIKRRYIYRIIQRRAPLTVDSGLAWNVRTYLDLTAMKEAAKLLIGNHDFTTFRSTECQVTSPVKTLDTLDVNAVADSEKMIVIISTTARSYLHKQVRSLVGCLKYVGEGKWTSENLQEALIARNRKACAPIAPACGLYLTEVYYE